MRAYSHIPVLLSAAALLTALSSCSKVETTERRDASITFRSSVVTKAPVDTDGQIDRFAVWAYRSDDAATLPEVEMNGIEVYRNGTGWAYDNVRMWTDGIWHFEAMYPDPQSLGTDKIGVQFYIPKNDGQVELDGVSISYFDGTNADADLMIAKQDRIYNSASNPDASAVSLSFEHLLSRVGISVKTTTEDLTLTSLTFKGMGVIGAYNTKESGEDKWMLLNSVSELESVVPTGTFEASLDESPLPSDGTAVDVLSDLLLIPQTPGTGAAGQQPMTVDVTYTVGSGGAETKTLTIPADPVWDPGSRYRYTLTLGTADVTLDIDVVKWTTQDYTVEW